MFQKGNQFEQQFCFETARWEAERFTHRRISPVRPLARYAEAAILALAENQRIDAGHASLLEHFKALPSKRMKRMANLRPSQIRTDDLCSSHEPSQVSGIELCNVQC